MVCKYDDGDGWCTGKFKGFGCIKSKCDLYTRIENGSQECTGMQAKDTVPETSGKRDCNGMPGDGTYCYKYNRFFCAGKENCADSHSYVKEMKMSSC